MPNCRRVLLIWACGLVSAAFADNRVLIVGIDGLGGAYLPQVSTPNLDGLAAAGSVRYDFLNEGALVGDPPPGYGASGVNWSTILTGVGGPTHEVVDNSFAGNRFDQHPTLFHHVRMEFPAAYTASLSHWNPINTQIVADIDVDLEIGGISDDGIRDVAVSLLTNEDPMAVFVHFDQVDGAGHSYSWGSSQYDASVQTVDGLIGDLIAAVNSRPGVTNNQEDWLILVTSDHGGEGFGHSAGQGLINWEVPFIASGPSVTSGSVMQRGTLRDVASTALWHLGIDPFVLGLEGTVRGISIDPPNGVPGDINQDGRLSGNGRGPIESDDVSAFVSHWLQIGGGGIPERYQRGDLNFDGITDLGDWALFNELDPSIGRAVARALSGNTVPEPSAMCGMLIILVGAISVRAKQARGFTKNSAIANNKRI